MASLAGSLIEKNAKKVHGKKTKKNPKDIMMRNIREKKDW